MTVARSDYGHLTPLLREVAADPALDLRLFVSGAHLAERFGRTERLIIADGWTIDERVLMLEDDDSPAAVARALGRGIAGFATALTRRPVDLLVVLGDRFEMLAAALAALPHALPVAHIHGGELSEGAVDESIRHALTKLAHFHFVSAEPHARRLRQLGEEAWRVHCTGAPGLDRFRTMRFLSREALAARLGVALVPPVVVVAFHPVTLQLGDTARHIGELTAALAGMDATWIVTYPGADAGHRTVLDGLETFAGRASRARLLPSLGDDVFASLLREADAMVGNSSSGLMEAPSCALPVVDIGDRQRGRLRAGNVIDVPPDRAAVAAGLARALDPAFRDSLRGMTNPYGDGEAAPRIVKVLAGVELGPRLITKRFVDLPAP